MLDIKEALFSHKIQNLMSFDKFLSTFSIFIGWKMPRMGRGFPVKYSRKKMQKF